MEKGVPHLWDICDIPKLSIIMFFIGAGNPLNFFNFFFHFIFPGIQSWFSFAQLHCTLYCLEQPYYDSYTVSILSVFLFSCCSARSDFILCPPNRGLSSLFHSSCSHTDAIQCVSIFPTPQGGQQPSRSCLRSKGIRNIIHCLCCQLAVSPILLAS